MFASLDSIIVYFGVLVCTLAQVLGSLSEGLVISGGIDHADIHNPSDIDPNCLNTSEYVLPDTYPEGIPLYGMYPEGTYVNINKRLYDYIINTPHTWSIQHISQSAIPIQQPPTLLWPRPPQPPPSPSPQHLLHLSPPPSAATITTLLCFSFEGFFKCICKL